MTGRGGSLPPCLGLVTLSLLVQLFNLGQDVPDLPLSHLQKEQARRREWGPPKVRKATALHREASPRDPDASSKQDPEDFEER